LLKALTKKANSLRSNSAFFVSNANPHHLSNSDTPADAGKNKYLLPGWAFEPLLEGGSLLVGAWCG